MMRLPWVHASEVRGFDGTVWLWDIDAASWAARLRSLANRNLSIAEWEQFIGTNQPYRRACPALPPLKLHA